MNRVELARRLQQAMAAFLREDIYLLQHDVSERCIASRLALHLQAVFPAHKVDVEYNRAGDLAKRLELPEECANSCDENGRALVVPDIIVHKRGPAGPNLLGIELKKRHDPRGPECDRKRIVALKAHLRYEHGVLLVCDTGDPDTVDIQVLEWID